MPEEKKMSLFGGLLAEGLDAGLRTFQSMTRDQQVKALADAQKTIVDGLRRAAQEVEGARSERFRSLLMDILTDSIDAMTISIDEIMEDPIGTFFEYITFPFRIIVRISEVVWASFYDYLLGVFEPRGPVSYQEAYNNAVEFFTIAGDFNIVATIFDILGHIQIFGCKLPANAISFFIRNISWTFGLGWLTWVVMGPVLRHSIADPYDKHVRQITRPADFTVTQIQEFYEHGVAELESFTQRLIELGYADDKILMLYELMKKRVLREEARRYITDVANAYVKGYITQETLMQAITLGYWTDDERNFRLMEENVRKQIEIIDTRVKEIERAFKRGKIDEGEATARLSEYIVDPDMREAYIALWKQYIKPEEDVQKEEELKQRKATLEIRIRGLEEQKEHLMNILNQKLEVFKAMLDEVDHELEVKLNAITDEFRIVRDAVPEAIEERFKGLKAVRALTLGDERIDIDARILLLGRLLVTEQDRWGMVVDDMEDLFREETEKKKAEIEQKQKEYKERMQMRIDKLDVKIEEYQFELKAIERVLEKQKGLTPIERFRMGAS